MKTPTTTPTATGLLKRNEEGPSVEAKGGIITRMAPGRWVAV